MFDINFSVLKDFFKNKTDTRKEFKNLYFQSSIRDFSFNVEKKISAGEIVNFVKSLNKELIRSVKIFDNYSDGLDSRAIALEVKIQSEHKTLSDSEINDLCEQIVKATEEKFSVKLR